MDRNYWRKQSTDQPLFPEIEWSKPEQKAHAGKLGIVGGNKLGFAGVADSYQLAQTVGLGSARVLLPEALKKAIPATFADVVFAPNNPSGGLSRDALDSLKALSGWADGILLAGDAGRNSETAILYEQFISSYPGKLIITRDAVDLMKNSTSALIERPETLLVVSFAQLQKIFQSTYYPVVLTFSMQLANLVDALHKFTITYPVTIMVLHKDSLVAASGGEVVTTNWDNPMAIWRGQVAAAAAVYWLWHPKKPLEAVSSSLLRD